jgi:hypothetical protein
LQEFLAQAKLKSKEQIDAKKSPMPAAEAIRLARAGKRVIAMRGQRVADHELTAANAPSDAELTSLIVGPSGNLRAPALRSAQTLLVGFHAATLEKFFGA